MSSPLAIMGGRKMSRFFGALDGRGRLAWVVYLEESNPFNMIQFRETSVIAGSTSGVLISVDIVTPDFRIPPA